MATKQELLKNKAVIDEINKHKWIESQKVGYDIGFERAAEDWITHFADEWENSHVPKKGPKLIIKGKKER
jgi:bacillopeptidase F (M6 metalloprotease family)